MTIEWEEENNVWEGISGTGATYTVWYGQVFLNLDVPAMKWVAYGWPNLTQTTFRCSIPGRSNGIVRSLGDRKDSLRAVGESFVPRDPVRRRLTNDAKCPQAINPNQGEMRRAMG